MQFGSNVSNVFVVVVLCQFLDKFNMLQYKVNKDFKHFNIHKTGLSLDNFHRFVQDGVEFPSSRCKKITKGHFTHEPRAVTCNCEGP